MYEELSLRNSLNTILTSEELDIEPGITVKGDSERLTVLIQNLLPNCPKHGQENGNIWVMLPKETCHKERVVYLNNQKVEK